MNTNSRLARRIILDLPERIEAAVFRMRLDKLTAEPPVECECQEHGRKCRCYLNDDDDL